MRSCWSTLVFALSAAAMSAQAPTTWPIRDAPPELRTVIARADLMIVAMHDSVLRELADKFAQGGADTGDQFLPHRQRADDAAPRT